jgi:hypothetical protein
MSTPIQLLLCSGVRLELFPNCVVIRRTGWLSHLLRQQDQTIFVKDIRRLYFYPGSALLNGALCIFPRPGCGEPDCVVFSRQHLREAKAIYQFLDDVVNRKDILSIVRQMQPR